MCLPQQKIQKNSRIDMNCSRKSIKLLHPTCFLPSFFLSSSFSYLFNSPEMSSKMQSIKFKRMIQLISNLPVVQLAHPKVFIFLLSFLLFFLFPHTQIGATLTHSNILNNGFFVGENLQVRFWEDNSCNYQKKQLKKKKQVTENDVFIVPVPLFHCFGMGIFSSFSPLTIFSSLISLFSLLSSRKFGCSDAWFCSCLPLRNF